MKTFLSLLLAAVSLALAAQPLPAIAQTTPRKPATTPSKVVSTRSAAPRPAPPAPPAPAPAVPSRAATPAPPVRVTATSTTTAATTDGPFGVGTSALNLGIGLGNRYSYGTGFFGGSSSVSPALSLSYERGVIALGPGVLGVGAYVGYQGAKYDLGGGDQLKYTDVLGLVRAAWHYPVSDKLDAYGGLGLGVRRLGVSFEGSGLGGLGASSSTDLVTTLFVGGRYFFSPGIGAFAEAGYDQTFLKLGLTAKF